MMRKTINKFHGKAWKRTSSIAFSRRLHIPWRRYLLQVAIRGISATSDPCTLQQESLNKHGKCLLIQL